MMRTIKQSKLCMLKNSTGIGIWAEIYIATERKYKILLIWFGKFCLSTGHLPPLLTSCCSLRAAARTDWFIVFNATFSNISAISWRPVLVVEEAGVPRENHWPWAKQLVTLSLVAVSQVHPFFARTVTFSKHKQGTH